MLSEGYVVVVFRWSCDSFTAFKKGLRQRFYDGSRRALKQPVSLPILTVSPPMALHEPQPTFNYRNHPFCRCPVTSVK